MPKAGPFGKGGLHAEAGAPPELLDEAVHGADCNCPTTATAYLKLARAEWFQLIDGLNEGVKKDKFRTAVLYIDRLIDKQTSVSKAAHLAFAFWAGFDDGLRENTFPGKASAAFRRGYRYGREIS